MITIFHGENITASRNALPAGVSKIDGKTATPEILAQLLEGESLFGQDKVVVLENLKSLPKEISQEISRDVILWFDHKLTARELAQFPKALVQEFKLDPVVFKFVESIKPHNQKVMLLLFKEYLKQEVPEIIFAMIARQFRLMLSPIDLAPWQLAKIKSQASHFPPQKLKQIYKDLLRLDYEQKTGFAPGDLKGSLELFLLTL